MREHPNVFRFIAHSHFTRPGGYSEFVTYLTAIIAALTQTSARVNGIAVDPDAPLHRAFPAG